MRNGSIISMQVSSLFYTHSLAHSMLLYNNSQALIANREVGLSMFITNLCSGISRLDDEDFTTQEPTESLYVVINKLQQQQKVNSRTQEILQNSIEKRLKTQQADVEVIKNKMVPSTEVQELKTKLEALENQNKEILEKLTQIAQRMVV